MPSWCNQIFCSGKLWSIFVNPIKNKHENFVKSYSRNPDKHNRHIIPIIVSGILINFFRTKFSLKRYINKVQLKRFYLFILRPVWKLSKLFLRGCLYEKFLLVYRLSKISVYISADNLPIHHLTDISPSLADILPGRDNLRI